MDIDWQAELVCNPDGCSKFEPNQFKKDKCKNCGRLWYEHKGVITKEQALVYIKARQKVLDEQNKKEELAREKARAKAIAKKKATQAVEDDWLFDGNTVLDMDDSDEDTNFRMLTPTDMAERIPRPLKDKKVRVVNLIDFSECDVQEEKVAEPSNVPKVMEPETESPGLLAAAPGPAIRQSLTDSAMLSPHLPGAPVDFGGLDHGAPAGNAMAPAQAMLPSQQEEELLDEIEHLRQMLADANEEKSIQVAIVQDEVAIVKEEVAERQQRIEALQRQQAEMESQLQESQSKLGAMEESLKKAAEEREEALALAEKNRQEAEHRTAEAQLLKASVEQLRSELDSSRSAAPDRSAESEQLQQEVQKLRAELERVQASHAADAEAQAQELETEVQQLRSDVARLHAAAHKRDQQALEAQQLQQAEVARLQGALEARQPQAEEAPAAAAGMMSEMRELCARTQELLGGGISQGNSGGGSDGQSADAVGSGLEAALRNLHSSVLAVHDAAVRVSTEQRQLSSKLRDLEKASPLTKRGIPGEGPFGVLHEDPRHTAVERQAALALKEMRLNAEQQLAWISKRMRTSPSALET